MNADAALGAVEGLLAEPPGAARARGHTTWLARSEGAERRLVLFGAGNLGRRVAGEARALGYEVVAFADNAPARHGTTVDGIPVWEPARLAQTSGADATWLVTIFGAGQHHRFADTEARLRALGVARVASFGHFAWHHPDRFLPYYALGAPEVALSAAPEILRVLSRLADDLSRETFVAQLRWRLHLDFAGLPIPLPPAREYFDDELVTWTGGTFVDGGAYDGDTVARFLGWVGDRFARVLAVEADPANLERLRARLGELPAGRRDRISVVDAALAATDGWLRFAGEGTAAGAASPSGNLTVRATTLERIVDGGGLDLLKVDIEGAEPEVLESSRALLARWRPSVAACAYHAPDHLWVVPGLLLDALPDAPLRLRSYGSEPFDLVAYADGRAR